MRINLQIRNRPLVLKENCHLKLSGRIRLILKSSIYVCVFHECYLKVFKGSERKVFFMICRFWQSPHLDQSKENFEDGSGSGYNYFSSNPQHWLFEKFDGVSPGP